MLTEAAIAAGFLDIEFLEEPSAAAWDHHTQIQEKATVLIVDIGGGTTDIAFSELGQSVGSPIIYQTWGLPKGGNDIDVQLNMRSFMPLFGKGVQGVPVHHFHSAALVHDLPRQAEFHAASFDKLASPYNSRLKRLQDGGNTVRLNRAAERSKIFLSEKENCSIGLSFIEKGLFAKMRREHLADAADATLFRLQETLSNVRSGINKPIDLIYVTGGMSNAPYVRDSIQEVFPSIPLVRGNASTAVVSGLAEFANTINKSDSSMNPYLTRR